MSLIQINDVASKKQQIIEETSKDDFVSIGIDLGTSNSVITYHDGKKLEVISDSFGDLIPSVVFYDKNSVLVGKNTLEKQKDNLVFKSIKRFMGKSKDNFTNDDILYEFSKDTNDQTIRFKNQQNKYVTPEEISGEILKYLKSVAEKKIGKKVKSAVITVPAYFDENQRIATKNSAQLAGLEVLRLINEPTSAALAYGLDKEDDSLQGIYLVYDLGGGTFDISILQLQKGVFKVLATLGDTALGGDDIDNIILQEIYSKLGSIETSLEKSKILEIAKSIKEELSFNDVVNKKIEILGKSIDFSINKNDFEEKISNIVEKTIDMCKSAIIDAKISNLDVKGIILVGGSTKIPYIQNRLEKEFSKKTLCSINPDLVVAMGAGYKSAELSGKTANSLLLDVIPLSLGLETAGGIVEKVIHRNTLIPITKKQEFTTFKDNQTAMLIHILQGERELVKDNRSLGKFSLKGIPPMSAGVARIMVSFSIDADGLLRVEAVEEKTGISQSVEIKPSWGLDFNSMRQIIEDGMENAEEDMKQRLLLSSKTEAQRVIDALVVALQEDGELLDEDYKVQINKALKNLINATNGDDRLIIDDMVKELDAVTSKFAGDRMNKKINKVLSGKKISDVEKDLV